MGGSILKDNYIAVLDYIRQLKKIDTHEHLPAYERLRDKNTDILHEYLSFYFSCDLVSAGLTKRELSIVRDVSRPLMERWKLVELYWEAARNTGYGRALDRTVNLLYGVEKISGDTIEEANRLFLNSLSGGQYQYILKELCNIEMVTLDSGDIDEDSTYNCDRGYFTPVFNVDKWIRPGSIEDMICLAEKQGLQLNNLEDYEQALRKSMEIAYEHGICAIKCSLAYNRSLNFKRVSRCDAERALTRAMAYKHPVHKENRQAPGKVFEDYMMHYSCALAAEFDLTYQIHTGLQEGYGNLLSASDPFLLINLFLEYPSTRFDIFHIGYPWHIQLAALAKSFPNVYIDMCWAHIVSPNASKMALSEYLDAVPANKIMAFGGDYSIIDPIFAHLEMAEENVARVLAEKIASDIFDFEEVCRISKMLFYDNPVKLFKLKQ